MLEKLSRKDFRLLALCAAVGALSLFVGVKYYFRAFPEASIDFRVTKEGSLPLASSFLSRLGLDVSGYRHAAVFGFDDQAKTFLEREVGVAEANRLLGTSVRLWQWRHRWFKPLQKEEIQVRLTTRGEVVGFRRALPEEAAGENIEQAEARGIAERFLEKTMGRPLDALAFVEGSTEKRPSRTDHSFAWKVKGSEVKDADYRIEVGVAGAAVTSYTEYLKVPDTWIRDYAKLRSKNEAAGTVDAALLALTAVAMLAVLVSRIRRGDVRFRTALVFGGITVLLVSLSQLNEFPSALYGYDTTASYGGFVLQFALRSLGAGLAAGILILFVTASAEPLYRQRFRPFLSLSSLLRFRALRSREFFIASAVGITLTFFFFAYENVFYLIANSLGAWSPREVPYSELLSTAFPWAFVLFLGWLPAISEEFISRMFSIPFFERIFRSTFLAVVVQAFIWGFGHAAYPNQPFWIRGLEVGLAGCVFGWVMLRFGIVAVVLCHFSVDALYAAFLLLRSGDPYNVVTGALCAGVFVLLFLAALGLYLWKKGFLPADRTNEAEGTAPPLPARAAPEARAKAPSYRPLGSRAIALGLLVAAALAALRLIPVPYFGDWARLKATRSDARAAASSFLAAAGFDVSADRSCVLPLDRTYPTSAAYLQKTGGLDAARAMFKDRVPTPLWRVRFFVPGRHEEYRVSVDPATTEIVGFTRALPESAPGAFLSGEEALEKARTFLAARGLDPATGEMKEQTSKDEKARRDHTLSYDYPVAGGGEARARIRVVIQGDRVGEWTREDWVPEEWRRDREKQTVVTGVLEYLKFPYLLVWAVFALLLLVSKIRSGEIPWRFAIGVGVLTALAKLLCVLLSLDTFWDRYPTTMSIGIYQISVLVGILLTAVLFFFAGGLTSALAGALYPDARAVLTRASRTLHARDALIAGVISLGVALGLPALMRLLESLIPAGRVILGAPMVASAAAGVPSLFALGDSIADAVFTASLLAAGIALLRGPFRSAPARMLLALFLVLSFLPPEAREIPEYLLSAVRIALYVGALVIVVRTFLRGNALAYVWSAYFTAGVLAAASLLSEPAGYYRNHGLAVLALVLIPGLWLVRDALASRTQAPPPHE